MATQLGNVAVGTVLKLNENGTPQNYIVVHQGLPSSMYDASCNGTWLLRQNILENQAFDVMTNSNKYQTSTIFYHFNDQGSGGVLWMYDQAIKEVIKQVKIPYRQNGGSGGTDRNGANGLSCKIFLLSGKEVGWDSSDSRAFPNDGAKLSYFLDGTGSSANQKRVATLNGSATIWWLRSPLTSDTSLVWGVNSSGKYGNWNANGSCGVRPAMIMPTNLIVDDNNNITANVVPSAPTSVTVPTSPVVAGSKFTLSWVNGANAQGYVIQTSLDGGSWYTSGSGTFGSSVPSTTSLTQTSPRDSSTVQYRVANTAYGFTSPYVESSIVNILQYTVTTFTVPSQVMQGQTVPISWRSVSGADTYVLQRKVDSGEWEQVYSGGDTSYTDTAASWTTVQYQIQAGSGSVFGTWTTSGVIPVIAASALVISGTDGNLGTLTADVPYTVSSDTGNDITLTRTVNGVLVASLTVQNGFAYNIPVMDLPTGTGTIVISVTVQASGGSVSASRTWTYTKVPFSFPGTGSTAQLQQDGNNVFPATLAECVRVGANLGGNLGLALQALGNSAQYDPETGNFTDPAGNTIPVPKIETGSYTGTGTSGIDNPNTLTFTGNPVAVIISTQSNQGHGGTVVIFEETYSAVLYGTSGIAPFYFTQGTVLKSGNSVSWYSGKNFGIYYSGGIQYSAGKAAAAQFNYSGETYNYVAFVL